MKNTPLRPLIGVASVLLCALQVPAGEEGAAPRALWVNNMRGADSHPGTEGKPFASIARGLAHAKPGTKLHVMPTDIPYPGEIRVEISGTAAAPIAIDGHGSLVSNRRQLPADAWKAEGNGVYSRPLPNNAWGMERHWEGGFPLVWFDGEPGRNATNRQDLAALGYFLHKNRKEMKTDPLHNTLFIRLPDGKTFDGVGVESIAGRGGIYVAGSHVTVRNFITEYGGTDGFATHRNQGVVFENIEARYFMDQGMSHHGAEVVVRNAHFHHNAGCGIVDVYPEAKVRYENCLIEDDTWRGGVEFHKGEFEMVDCVIRGNPGKAVAVVKGAQATLRNCLLVGPEDGKAAGIVLGDESSLQLDSCTLYGFDTGLRGALTAETRLAVRRCAFLRCITNLRLTERRDAGAPEVVLSECITAGGNLYEPRPFALISLEQAETGGWKRQDKRFDGKEHAAFAALIGTDRDALIQAVPAIDDPMALPAMQAADGKSVGSRVGPMDVTRSGETGGRYATDSKAGTGGQP